jgi:predicted RNA-binding Zn ribbon-like protein
VPSVNDATDRLTNDATVTEILADWRRRLRSARDLRPREGVRGQRERSLTRALLAAADAPENSPNATESLGKLAMIAALYGADQPRERLDPGALCEELGHLRQAVWHHLRQRRLNADVATQRILAFDRALTLALRAAVTGGYQCEGGDSELTKTLPAIATDAVGPSRPTR